jgi:hypothetical protein
LPASSSGIPPRGADSTSSHGEVEKIAAGKDSLAVRKLTALSIAVTPLGARSSDITTTESKWLQRTCELAYHKRELVVPANLRTSLTICMQPLSKPELYEGVLQYIAFI